MSSTGTSIIFVNSDNQVLLCLRDDIPTIPYPNRWDILGGHIEEGETPEECIIREIKEEIGFNLVNPRLFEVERNASLTNYTFWQRADFDLSLIELREGQRLKWFSEDEISAMPDDHFAFGFKRVLLEFLRQKPFGPQ